MAATSLLVSSAKYYGFCSRRELLNCSRCPVWRYLPLSRHYQSSLVQARKRKLGFRNFSFLTWLEKFGLYQLSDKKETSNQPDDFDAKSDQLSVLDNRGRRLNQNFVADVVEKIAETVVYIEIKDTRKYSFITGAPYTASHGSGFIVRHDGLILTNAHVVLEKPHNKIQVNLQDGSTYIGTLEDVDTKSDLATVRIPCKNLPVMKLGKSRNVRPGEFVVAIGSPLSFTNTITFGVVSSVNRPGEELGRGKDMHYIQTDASINFGNSGGPLVNLNSEAIGISSMGVIAGISFAIPIDYAKDFLVNSVENKKVQEDQGIEKKRFYLGVTVVTLTPQILEIVKTIGYTLPPDLSHGVIIWKVVEDSPAHSVGIERGDVITHVNKKPIFHSDDVYAAMEAGKAIRMTVFRDEIQFDVTVYPETL